MSIFIELDEELVRAAERQAKINKCTVAQQIERWAMLGKAFEAHLSEEGIQCFLDEPQRFKIVHGKII